MNCVLCKEPLDPVLEPAGSHPTCFPFAELDEEDPFIATMKTKLIDVILWAYRQNPRNTQVSIGPSELGAVCDRRIGYRLADVPRCNTEWDPWPVIMGTSMHSWLQQAFDAWNRANGDEIWLTERRVHLDELISGSSDLYDMELRAIVDWKSAGPDVMRKIRKEGVPLGYKIQTQLYGYGFTRLGFPVEKVCLAFLGRAGWLKDMYLWCEDYDESVAVSAISRTYEIATHVLKLETSKYPDRWNDVPATPSNDCGWCPWYDAGRTSEQGADATGCPGR